MLIRGELEQLEHYVDRVGYTEHNPGIGDGNLFRLSEGKIVEHLDTTEAVPPRSEWKNENGKF